jgi:hypothetical protein
MASTWSPRDGCLGVARRERGGPGHPVGAVMKGGSSDSGSLNAATTG